MSSGRQQLIKSQSSSAGLWLDTTNRDEESLSVCSIRRPGQEDSDLTPGVCLFFVAFIVRYTSELISMTFQWFLQPFYKNFHNIAVSLPSVFWCDCLTQSPPGLISGERFVTGDTVSRPARLVNVLTDRMLAGLSTAFLQPGPKRAHEEIQWITDWILNCISHSFFSWANAYSCSTESPFTLNSRRMSAWPRITRGSTHALTSQFPPA
jgi:hypothetical protein